jgi:hypothetical protein
VPYKQAIGSLNYLATRTRPDIAFAVNRAARAMQNPKEKDWIAVKRIFRYLQGTKNLSLRYLNEKGGVTGYSDASYASEMTDRKSISGYVFMKGEGAISWRSKKQSIVSLSSMESEYIALTDAIKDGIWINRLEIDMDPEKLKTVVIMEDNQSTIKIAQNDIHNDRSKHIDTRYHFVREQVTNGILKLQYCPTEEMIADTFTKPLLKTKFDYFCKRLGLTEVSNKT